MRNDTQTAAPATSPAAPRSEKIPAPTMAPTPMKAAWRMVKVRVAGGAGSVIGAPRLPIRRNVGRCAHRFTLREVHRDPEEQRTPGEEERRPVDPEVVAGVARVPDEEDREDQREDRDRRVADETGRLDRLVVEPA